MVWGRWCHDIGREHAANKPLLKTVFQVLSPLPLTGRPAPLHRQLTAGHAGAARRLIRHWRVQVMMRLFTPRKTTLLFVIRDKTKVGGRNVIADTGVILQMWHSRLEHTTCAAACMLILEACCLLQEQLRCAHDAPLAADQ